MEGQCPKCKNWNLNYDEIKIEGNSIYYPWTCEDYGASRKEWYSLEFSEQELDAKGGE